MLWYLKYVLTVIIMKNKNNKPFSEELRLFMDLIKSENWLNAKKVIMKMWINQKQP